MAKLPRFLRVLHWVIIVNFLLNVLYGTAQVFFVLAPEGSSGLPLFGAARKIDPDLMIARRLYAVEVWISIGALCVYLALTEYLPRLLRGGDPERPPAQ